jgi:hypothetical protein
MKSTLPRPLVDKLAGAALLGIACAVLVLDSPSGLFAQLLFGAFIAGAAVNAAFVLFTPIATTKEQVLNLYSEAQPVIIGLRPKRVELKKVQKIIIDKKSIYPRAILCLAHGERIYHGFPARSEKRLRQFLNFIGEDIPREEAK